MFEGLIEFIETTLFTLVNKIADARPQDGVGAGAADRRRAARLRGEESGDDARADRRRARQRGRAAAGADEPALRPDRGGAAAGAAHRAGERQLAGRSRRPTPTCCSRSCSADGSFSRRAASSARRRTGGNEQRKLLSVRVSAPSLPLTPPEPSRARARSRRSASGRPSAFPSCRARPAPELYRGRRAAAAG